ncbi:UDP-N-acetylmuramate dehydrogenase [Candidatus Nomurabacteria bacterium]|nr:UDP-N-acetylmuramate dehydrogenase [Candidatus Nomurabacteria bacterium]
MKVHTQIPLRNYTTMKIGGPARFMTNVHTKEELVEAINNAQSQNIPFHILGSGSNTIVHDEGYDGLIIRNCIEGSTVLSDSASSTTLEINAGENWDSVVKRTVEMNLRGIEALSAIPGTAGAAPVQNIGAYGQEIADTLVSLTAYDSLDKKWVTLENADCEFSYRSSIFREGEAGRYAINSITLELYKSRPEPPFYAAVQEYFDTNHITQVSVADIRTAVMAIRADKLPNPAEKPNSGSFFKNAIVEEWHFNDLIRDYPSMPHYDMGNKTYKIPTGWLIEQCGLKGSLISGMRVHDKNALVLINESANGYGDLALAREEIKGAVRDTFRIQIEQEPLEI